MDDSESVTKHFHVFKSLIIVKFVELEVKTHVWMQRLALKTLFYYYILQNKNW